MASKIKTRGNSVPLIIENHPDDYIGYPFITLIRYRNQNILTIVDNANDKQISAFVLDLCGPSQLDEEVIINVAFEWFQDHKNQYPLSFDFSRLGLSNLTSKIYRTFNTEFITRVIGPLPKFEMKEIQSVKRRRRKAVPTSMHINKK